MKRALVLSLAIVLGLGLAAFAQELTGSWDTTITIDPQALALGDLFSFTSDLTVTYKVAGWTFSSFTTLDDTGWSAQSFTAGGALGAFTFGSTLVFAPATPAFTSWTVTGGVSIAGMTFDMTFVSTPGEVALTLGGYGSAGLVDIDIDVTFGDPTAESGCDFDWTGITIVAGFPFCCVETVDFTLAFTCDGFEYAQFDVVGIEVPMLPWLFIDATLKYELQTKTLTLSPNFVFGADVCFDLYMGFGYGGNLIIDDLYIEGIGLICEIDGISFEGISFWGTSGFVTKPTALGDYWEMYRISTTDDDACCGPFDFDIAVFFDDAHTTLFDVAAFEANMSLEIGDQFTFGMGLDYEVGTGATLWSLDFLVTW